MFLEKKDFCRDCFETEVAKFGISRVHFLATWSVTEVVQCGFGQLPTIDYFNKALPQLLGNNLFSRSSATL